MINSVTNKCTGQVKPSGLPWAELRPTHKCVHIVFVYSGLKSTAAETSIESLHCIYVCMLSLRLHVTLHASVVCYVCCHASTSRKDPCHPDRDPAAVQRMHGGHQGCQIHQTGDLSGRTPDGLRGLKVRSTEHHPLGGLD